MSRIALHKKSKSLYQASVVGAVIQSTGTLKVEDSLRTGVLQEDCWYPNGSSNNLKSCAYGKALEAALDPGVVQPEDTCPIWANQIPMASPALHD